MSFIFTKDVGEVIHENMVLRTIWVTVRTPEMLIPGGVLLYGEIRQDGTVRKFDDRISELPDQIAVPAMLLLESFLMDPPEPDSEEDTGHPLAFYVDHDLDLLYIVAFREDNAAEFAKEQGCCYAGVSHIPWRKMQF